MKPRGSPANSPWTANRFWPEFAITDFIDPLYLFIFAGLFSPGPNVVMLITSGVRFGFGRTVPHILGVAVGVGITAGLTGLGLGELLLRQPGLTFALKCAAALWIFYLAWKLFQSTRLSGAKQTEKPFTFFQAVLFQWVNPKVWAIALAAAAGFGDGGTAMSEGMRLALGFSIINFFVCMFWTAFGHALTGLLTNPVVWRTFMTVMAVVLAISGLLVFF